MVGWAHGAVGSDPSKCPISVTRIELLDEHGQPCSLIDHGRRMRVRLHYEMRERVEQPNFTVAFIRSDNVACCNFSTALDSFDTDPAGRHGAIELLTPPVKLVSELYAVHVLVWDKAFQRLYCAQVGKNFHV